MVIDDSKTIRRSAETLLKKVGCEVVTAIDGFEALAKITEHKPDIIFVDIMMPRLDGYQTCALIKNNQTFKGNPGDHVIQQGQHIRSRARSNRGFGKIPDQAVFERRPDQRDNHTCRLAGRPRRKTEVENTMTHILIIDDSPTEVHVFKTCC